MSEPKQVIVIRHDLNMRKGKFAAQVAHASMKVLLDAMTPNRQLNLPIKDPLIEWLEGSFTKIVLRVDSEEELLKIQGAAMEAGIRTAMITDAGRTEFHGVPTITCVAIGPDYPEKIDKITGHLKLI